MKYRVKFYCYWYNTGAADNCNYWNSEDFDTLKEAEDFKNKLLHQKEMYDKHERKEISYDKWSDFNEQEDYYKVENGFIQNYDNIKIVRYFPESEQHI